MTQHTASADEKAVKMTAPETLSCLICAKEFNNSEFDQLYLLQSVFVCKALIVYREISGSTYIILQKGHRTRAL